MRNNNQESAQEKKEGQTLLYILTLFFVLAFFVQNNLIWLFQDTLPPSWDQSHHILLSLKHASSIGETSALSAIKEFFSISHYYPPLFYLTTAPVILLFGFTEDNVVMINFLYMFLFLISIYGIGKLLFNRRVGVGASLLIKLAAILFFLPLWVYVFIRRGKQTKNFSPLVVCLLISLGISLPWYSFAFKDLLALNSYYLQNFVMTMERDPIQFFPSLLWYAEALRFPLMSPNLFNLFFVGLSLFLIIGRKWRELLIFACWIVPAFFILIVTPNKDGRYLMPILPALSLLTVAGIDTVRIKIIRNALYFLVIAVGYIQFNNLSFNIFPDLIKEKGPYYYNHVPLQQDWKNKEVLSFLSERFPNTNLLIGILADHKYFSPAQLQLNIYLFRLPYSIEAVGDSPVSFEDIKRYDIFITKYPQISAEWVAVHREKFYKELSKKGIETLGFSKLTEYVLPDDSTLILYQKSDAKEKRRF